MFILLSNVLLLLVQTFVSGKQMLCIEGFFFTLLHYNYWCHVCFCKCEFNHLFIKAFFGSSYIFEMYTVCIFYL